MKIVLPGGAGLVGQNLVVRLVALGYNDIVVLDKHKSNLDVLKRVQPEITAICADVSRPGEWQAHFADASVVVMLQAQIGGNDYEEFVRNNVESTQLILDLIRRYRTPKLIHISSSVVESVADDFYTRTKKQQEQLVLASGVTCPVLRPTLMFGWFDRKHLGWLSRLIKRIPLFPIPGNGRYMRQPLYVGDFCNIIISCIRGKVSQGIYNVSGREKIDYIDIIREIKRITHSPALIVHIPYSIFHVLLWLWALFDKNPPFTTQQLAALCAGDKFEEMDWPGIFDVPETPFRHAMEETFHDPRFGGIVLDF